MSVLTMLYVIDSGTAYLEILNWLFRMLHALTN